MSDEWIGMTPRQRLINLFDAAAECRVDVVIWERDEPAAHVTLQEWAKARGMKCEFVALPGDVDGPHDGCWSVEISPHRRIDAWTMRAGSTAKNGRAE